MRTSVRSHRVVAPAVAIVLACTVCGAGWLAQARAQAPIVFKIATVNAGESPRNSAAYEFAKVVGEKSKGRIKAEVYIKKQLGANPVPMPWGEVYLAMKQGTVDAMETPIFTVVSDEYYEVTKYYSLTKHTY